VKVDELLQQAETYIGQAVELEGYLLVLLERDQYTLYLSASEQINDNVHLAIQQPLAEIRKIIQPMHTMILSHRGILNTSPYLYRFALHLSAQVDKTAENVPILRDIERVSLYVPYPENMAKWVEQKRFLYTADVEYGAFPDSHTDQPAKAKIIAQKVLRFVDKDDAVQILHPDENIYVRRIVQKPITIPGWLKYISGEVQHHYVLRTFAVRASMVGIGPLRGMTSIWWPPNPRYKVVRAHLSDREPDYNHRVDITGRIDYIHPETVPLNREVLPQLTFTQVDEVVVHQEHYLLDVEDDASTSDLIEEEDDVD
jgi:hypothetical protein